MISFIIPKDLVPPEPVLEKANNFLEDFKPFEILNGTKLVLFFDKKSEAYYFICHLSAKVLVNSCDLQASLDGMDDDEIVYKLNRDITEDKSAFKDMVRDAELGRSFEDIVTEYDTTYQEDWPLKIYGGQHRIKAIVDTLEKVSNTYHGIRVYFNLSREQKVEIATINNTSIAVSNDLLDRMREQMVGTELRDWCQKVGLLPEEQDFADKKSPDIPTVRIARTLIVNIYQGSQAKDIDELHQPILCKSGGMDEKYLEVRKKIKWSNKALQKMGEEFAKLHKMQISRVQNRTKDTSGEFARKALSLAVVSSWAFAAGLFQNNKDKLQTHYSLPDKVSAPNDPLNAKALSQARLKGVDPDTYRGLGARTSAKELGRMLEVFLVHASLPDTTTTKGINLKLANAAIKSYEAKKATYEAKKALGNI